jgi:hypothetical protein
LNTPSTPVATDPLAESEITSKPQPVAWRPKAWRRQFDPEMPHSTFYGEVERRLIDIVKAGSASWVTTPHREYLRRRQAFNDAKAAA